MKRSYLPIGAGAVALLAAVIILPSAAWADNGSISSVSSSGKSLSVVVSARVPVGSELVPSSIVMTVDGKAVPAALVQSEKALTSAAPRVAMLAIDTSGSMAGAPLAGVKQAADVLLADLPKDVEVGLVSFGDSVHLLAKPTLDRKVVSARIAGLVAAGNTTLYDAIDVALGQLGPSGPRLLCVLSDGQDTASRTSLAAVTASLRRAHLTTELIGYRTDVGQTTILAKLATAVHGRLVPVSDTGSLIKAFGVAAGTFATQVRVQGTLPAAPAKGTHVVVVSLRFGSVNIRQQTTFVASGPAVSGSGSPQATAASAVPFSRRTVGALLLLVFVALLLLLLAVLLPRPRADERLRSLEAYRVGASAAATAPPDVAGDTEHGIALTALGVSERFVERRGNGDKLAILLDRANVRLKPGEWVLLRACGGVLAIALASILLGNLILGAVVGVLIAAACSHLYLSIKASRRTKAFEAALPDTLQLVASSIRTGFSLPQALDAAASGGTQPISGELNRALVDARLGAQLEDGLDSVADRMESQDLRWTVMAIRIQREVGGNLSEVLHTTARTMRDRAAMRRRVRALSAEGRLSAYILIALPILLTVFMYLTRREYLSLLWTSTPGLVLSALAIVGMVVGSLWMRTLAKVEV